MVYLGKTIQREMYFGAKPDLFILAKEMRKNPTESERVLWNILRKFRAEGFIFRQQHPIDIFIADFYCHKLKLVIEVDGGIHLTDQAQENDDGRSGELEKLGIRIIRFTNEQVLNDQLHVLNKIHKYMTETASPALLGAGDGRG
jgi:very-short-patch-repair endonuclease